MNIDEIFEKSKLLTPMQEGEIIDAGNYIIKNLDIRSNGFIEIGSAYGGSFYFWASLLSGPAISIDLPNVINVTESEKEYRNNIWLNNFGERVHIIEENSINLPSVYKQLDEVLGGNKVDFLFIDGNHSYKYSYNDFHNYKKYVRSGGLVAFHDIYHHGHKNGCAKVFSELKYIKYSTTIENGWAGIGIVHV